MVFVIICRLGDEVGRSGGQHAFQFCEKFVVGEARFAAARALDGRGRRARPVSARREVNRPSRVPKILHCVISRRWRGRPGSAARPSHASSVVDAGGDSGRAPPPRDEGLLLLGRRARRVGGHRRDRRAAFAVPAVARMHRAVARRAAPRWASVAPRAGRGWAGAGAGAGAGGGGDAAARSSGFVVASGGGAATAAPRRRAGGGAGSAAGASSGEPSMTMTSRGAGVASRVVGDDAPPLARPRVRRRRGARGPGIRRRPRRRRRAAPRRRARAGRAAAAPASSRAPRPPAACRRRRGGACARPARAGSSGTTAPWRRSGAATTPGTRPRGARRGAASGPARASRASRGGRARAGAPTARRPSSGPAPTIVNLRRRPRRTSASARVVGAARGRLGRRREERPGRRLGLRRLRRRGLGAALGVDVRGRRRPPRAAARDGLGRRRRAGRPPVALREGPGLADGRARRLDGWSALDDADRARRGVPSEPSLQGAVGAIAGVRSPERRRAEAGVVAAGQVLGAQPRRVGARAASGAACAPSSRARAG